MSDTLRRSVTRALAVGVAIALMVARTAVAQVDSPTEDAAFQTFLGEVRAAAVERGIRAGMANGGARTTEVTTILDELEAARHALDLGREGDIVVVCVDHPNEVWKELQHRQHGASSAGLPSMRAVTDLADLELEA